MTDFQITWGYIVKQMEERFQMPPDSDEPMSMAKIEARLDTIWLEWYKMRNKK